MYGGGTSRVHRRGGYVPPYQGTLRSMPGASRRGQTTEPSGLAQDAKLMKIVVYKEVGGVTLDCGWNSAREVGHGDLMNG